MLSIESYSNVKERSGFDRVRNIVMQFGAESAIEHVTDTGEQRDVLQGGSRAPRAMLRVAAEPH